MENSNNDLLGTVRASIDVARELSRLHPNNMDLGAAFRSQFRHESFACPNDMILGELIRKEVNSDV